MSERVERNRQAPGSRPGDAGEHVRGDRERNKRATLDGKNPGGWFPDQKLSVAEAIEAYTLGSAYAEFQESQKGSITPGKLADMVLLSDDIFSIPPEKIRDVRVAKTLVGGRLVFDASVAPAR